MRRARIVFLSLIFIATSLLTTVTTTVAAAAQAITLEAMTLIVVRHADRDNNFVDELNETGIIRAQALVDALSGVALDKIYIPDRVRNRETAAPLAAARGLEPIVIDTTQMSNNLLVGNEGLSVIWIGNTNNLSILWERLEAQGRAPLKYGDLFTVHISASGLTEVTRRHFGP